MMNPAKLPDAQFVENIVAGLTYWQEQTSQLDEQAIAELDVQRQNLYRIVRYGLVLPQTWLDTAVVTLQSFDLIEQRGYWQEWIPILEKAIAHCNGEHLYLKFKLLNQLGQLYRSMRQLPSALAAHEEAEAIAQSLGDEQVLAESHCNLSELYLRQRKYKEAEQYGLDALTKFTSIGAGERWLAITLDTLGELARFRGDLSLAEERLSQAVSYWCLLNEPVRMARALNDLAVTFLAAEKFEQARQCYTKVAALLEPTINELDKVMVQINLGVLYFRQEQWIEAESFFRKADSSYLRRSPHTYYQALVANNLGNVLLKQERLEAATSYLQNAITLWRQIGDKLELANTLGTLAEAVAAQGRRADAIPLYEEAVVLLSGFPEDAWAGALQEKFVAQQKAMKTKTKS